MNNEFAYNAPSFLDFQALTNDEDADSDSFFEVQEVQDDSNNYQMKGELILDRELSDTESDAVYFGRRGAPLGAEINDSSVYLKSNLRRSLSMNNLHVSSPQKKELEQAVEELSLGKNPSSMQQKTKFVSQEHINRLAQPKRFASTENLNGHVSLAEAVKKFQAGTPKRFRSRPNSPKIAKAAPLPCGATKAHTPNLTTMKRARPVTALTFEERERRELEEAKKFKIRAHPPNQQILKGPLKPVQAEKKPATTVEPFRLTEVKKKEAPVEKIPAFKAQPVPKFLNNPFKIRSSSLSSTAKPPGFVKKQQRTPRKSEGEKQNKSDGGIKPKPTKVQPFSFEKRDLALQKKKEDRINQFLEEERKAREFHANPPPKKILKSRNGSLSELGNITRTSKSSEDLETTRFKAKPATVLAIPPFKPRKDETRVLEVEAFRFSTDERIEARRKLDEHMKEREAKAAEAARERDEINKKEEEEEIAKLRKEAEHKAQPIRKYKEITIQHVHKVTIPKSPVFHTDLIRNKENIK